MAKWYMLSSVILAEISQSLRFYDQTITAAYEKNHSPDLVLAVSAILKDRTHEWLQAGDVFVSEGDVKRSNDSLNPVQVFHALEA